VEAISNESERIGITLKTGVEVQGIEKIDGKLRVKYLHEGQEHSIEANRVVNGTGRIANVEELNLDTANIQHDGIHIEVDKYLRSVSNPAVWVVGDALVHSAQLSPLATYEGRLVGQNIVDGAHKSPDYSVVPSAVYTVPALSSVGMTETEAEKAGIDVEAKTSDMSQWFSARFYAETVAWAKVLVEKGTRRIVGAHLVGHHGEELIHLFALAMRHNISADDLGGEIFAFPTFAADISSLV
jgi:glutathione reductase (NADPH)